MSGTSYKYNNAKTTTDDRFIRNSPDQIQTIDYPVDLYEDQFTHSAVVFEFIYRKPASGATDAISAGLDKFKLGSLADFSTIDETVTSGVSDSKSKVGTIIAVSTRMMDMSPISVQHSFSDVKKVDSVKDIGAALASTGIEKLASTAVGSIGKGALRQFTGTGLFDRNLKVYNGTTPSGITITFNFKPRSVAEQNAAMNIIKAFEFHSAPRLINGQSSVFYREPALVNLTEFSLVKGENGVSLKTKHPNFVNLRQAGITSVDVTHDNSSSRFVDGNYSAISMVVTLQSTFITHKADIFDGDNIEGGSF